MSKGKHKGKKPKTDSEKQMQKTRTNKNKVKKYEALLKDRPNDLHSSIWEKKLINIIR